MKEHPFSHFSMAGQHGFLNDVSITFIDKIDPSDPLWREDYRGQAPKTMVPYGLDTEEYLMGVSVFSFLHGNISFFYMVSMFEGL